MGRASNRKKVADRRSVKHLAVDDASRVLAGIQKWAAGWPHDAKDPEHGLAITVAHGIEQAWRNSPVMLRTDLDFVQALISSEDVELNAGWLEHSPFDYFGVSFPQPLSLHDGRDLCHYKGFLAAGAVSQAIPGGGVMKSTTSDWVPYGQMKTTYVPIRRGQGVRCVWVYSVDGDPSERLQTTTFMFEGPGAGKHPTLQALITTQIAQMSDTGQTPGDELASLYSVTLGLLMYLASSEPELEHPAPKTIKRPQQLQGVEIAHLGWRIGSALRGWRAAHDADERPDRESRSGWRLPPHIRRAHWTRVRMATRNEDGEIVGDRLGIEGMDWTYALRWIPPTPVNAGVGIPPTSREISPIAK